MDFKNFDAQKAHATQYLRRGQQVPAVILIKHASGDISAIEMDLSDNEAKAFSALTMRKFLHKVDAISYMFVSESWVTAIEDGDLNKRGERKEIVMFDVWDKTGVNATYTWDIARNSDGTGFVEDRDSLTHPTLPTTATGLLSNLFDSSPLLQLNSTQMRKVDKAVSTIINKRNKFRYNKPTIHQV
ncbi:hypothetical protein [Vibrio crassostreae]|uniref:hypothetical protein n=1 Tax=Vibrio crassostreae TaxID=246167 RepID=UPI001B30F6AF|nr:hypothetical protein [Vibrio crassostreae]